MQEPNSNMLLRSEQVTESVDSGRYRLVTRIFAAEGPESTYYLTLEQDRKKTNWYEIRIRTYSHIKYKLKFFSMDPHAVYYPILEVLRHQHVELESPLALVALFGGHVYGDNNESVYTPPTPPASILN